MISYLKIMNGSQSNVICAYCGKNIPDGKALKIALLVNDSETQVIYAHARHFVEHLNPSIPLHPDIAKMAADEVDLS